MAHDWPLWNVPVLDIGSQWLTAPHINWKTVVGEWLLPNSIIKMHFSKSLEVKNATMNEINVQRSGVVALEIPSKKCWGKKGVSKKASS